MTLPRHDAHAQGRRRWLGWATICHEICVPAKIWWTWGNRDYCYWALNESSVVPA